MQSFKENLRNELDFQNLTVKELVARTNVPKPTIDNYLGIRASIPPADIAVKIAKSLKVSVEYLITGSELNIPRDFKDFIIYKDFLNAISTLSSESWNELKPLFFAQIHEKQRQEQKKNQTPSSTS